MIEVYKEENMRGCGIRDNFQFTSQPSQTHWSYVKCIVR